MTDELDSIRSFSSNPSDLYRSPSLIMSFNTWGIFFGSPRPFTRPCECAHMIKKQIESFSGLLNANDRIKDDRLVFVCIQEAWSVQGGFLTPLVMLYAVSAAPFYRFWHRFVWPIASLWNTIGFVLETLIQVILSLSLMPLLQFTHLTELNQKYWYTWVLGNLLPHSVYPNENRLVLGNGKKFGIMDSGLLILSNHPATHCGFEAFKERDEPVGKGVMWAYYEKFNVAILNTHIGVDNRLDCDNRNAQVNQILALMIRLESKYSDIRCYICGDFNRCLNWPEFVAARSLKLKYARVGAVTNDLKWGNPKVAPLEDWDIAERPLKSTSLYGILDGIFVPHREKDLYNLAVSPISMLIGNKLCCGIVDRVSDHSLLWSVEKSLPSWPGPVKYWPKFPLLLQVAILSVVIVGLFILLNY